MYHCSFKIGTQHWNFILCLHGNEDNVKKSYLRADLAVRRIRIKPIVEDFLKSLRVIFLYE